MRRVLLLGGAALLVLVGLVVVRPSLAPEQRRLTVMFPSTTSLYEGAQVKVLGVRVGTVEDIAVEGTAVRVTMVYDPAVTLPADVHAVVVPPSVVGDRFIQLAPPYTGGAELADGATLGLDRSGVPLELEDTYRALDQVATSLGPQGANRDGALSRLVRAGAENLRGRGRLVNAAVRSFADAVATLAGSSDDVQGTTSELARLNAALAGDDAVLRRTVALLVAVGSTLARQGDALSAAVTTLDDALDRVARFAHANREALRGGIDDLTSITGVLRRHTRELEEITDLAPVGLVNLMGTYTPRNWDPTDRAGTSVEGRTGSQNLHAVFLQDLDIQLSATFGALCDVLPAASAAQLAPFCAALRAAGGDLGRVLLEAYHSQGGVPGGGAPLAPSPRELDRITGGAR
ncbi:MCE family protein [Nocardioides sp.]|uniref:MCE family protein n=1 Tax=Nocardioides sp. TaxID=35761 RepID=UPI0035171310